MLYLNRTDVPKGTDVNKTRESRKCNIENQGNVTCVTVGIFQIRNLSFNQMPTIDTMIY